MVSAWAFCWAPSSSSCRGCSPGSTCAGRTPTTTRYCATSNAEDRDDAADAGTGANGDRRAERDRDGVLLRVHQHHPWHHLVGGASHADDRTFLCGGAHGQSGTEQI